MPEVLPPGTYGASCGGKPPGNGSVVCGSPRGGGFGGDPPGDRNRGNPPGNGSSSDPRGTPPPPEPSTITGLSHGLPTIAAGTTLRASGPSGTGANQPGFGGVPVRGCFVGSQAPNLNKPLR